MIRIVIHRGEARTINYQKNGEARTLRAQEGYAFTVNGEGQPAPFPEKFEFLLDREQAPYPAGEYTLAPSALYVDRQGKLACGVRLVAAKRPATVSGA